MSPFSPCRKVCRESFCLLQLRQSSWSIRGFSVINDPAGWKTVDLGISGEHMAAEVRRQIWKSITHLEIRGFHWPLCSWSALCFKWTVTVMLRFNFPQSTSVMWCHPCRSRSAACRHGQRAELPHQAAASFPLQSNVQPECTSDFIYSAPSCCLINTVHAKQRPRES